MDINQSLNLYLKFLKFERNHSPNTIRAYQNDLEDLISFFAKNNAKNTEDINLDLFRSYLKNLDQFKYKHRTLIRKYSSYINFFKFLENNDFLKLQLSQLISLPKRQKLFYTFFTKEEINKLLNNINDSDIFSIRDRSLFEILYSTGVRVTELSLMIMENLNLNENEIIVLGKGRKYRTVYINDEAKKWLLKYLDIRNNFLFSKKNNSYKDSKYLFLNKNGGFLSDRMIRKLLKKYISKAKINKNVTPHGIRHSYATHLIEEGAGIREIQELLGHESIFTTQIYTHMNIKKLKNDFKIFHPRAK